MKVAGIVCEYNPMHNGHVYHIQKTRKAGATHIVCVMSGNFVQRGECAFLDKWTRAEIAINCGADLVVDLPTPWSCDSAQNFAFGAVSILEGLGIDMLSFGSEIDDKQLIENCAKASENERVVTLLKKGLQTGNSYPLSIYNAVYEVFGKETADVISSPNSTLALEYIKALKKLGSKADILPIKRFMSGHDESVTHGRFSGASYIRNLSDFKNAREFMPEYSYEKIMEQIEKEIAPCKNEYAERAILSFLRRLKKDEMGLYCDDENGLCERIFEAVKTAETLDELYEKVKTKNITMARVRRNIFRIFLEIPPDVSKKAPPYIRILASNKKGFEILKNLKNNLPIITKHSDSLQLCDFGKKVYDIQCRSTDLFALFSKKIRVCCLEQTSPVKIIK